MLIHVSILQAEVEETLKRIQTQKGVQGIIIVNSEGKIQKKSPPQRLLKNTFILN